MTKFSDVPMREKLQFLDGLRGLAAMYVMIGHSRWLLWEGYTEGYLKHPEQYTAFGKFLVYFLSLFTFGHEAVLFFFVLSGLVIHLKYSVKLKSDSNYRFEFSSYFIKRVKRIYPPLIFAILITTILDLTGWYFGFSIYSHLTSNNSINGIVFGDMTLKTLAGNLVLVMDAITPVWGTNGPLWSLKYEWWFYMLYPLLFYLNKRNISWSFAAVSLLFVASFVAPAGTFLIVVQISSYLFSWWIGCIIADMMTKRINVRMSLFSLFTLVFPALIMFRKALFNQVIEDTLWAVGFGGMIILLLHVRNNYSELNALSKLKWLGDCSYTLYVTHFPLLVFMSGVVLSTTSNVLPTHFYYVFLGIIVTIGFAWGSHFFVEKPFISPQKPRKQFLV
jgi:peptidoglycan/LPS O-acetylase OafA/YrhL